MILAPKVSSSALFGKNVLPLVKEMETIADPARAKSTAKYFKTGKGDYGEGDLFLGISTPPLRQFAKDHFAKLHFDDLSELLKSEYHEHRSVALMMLVNKFKKCKEETDQKEVVDYYLKNTLYINNWDLVDISCYHILGAYLIKKKSEDREVLHTLAKSKSLWERRISIVSTMTFIKAKEYDDTLKIAVELLKDNHDLIHKAVGWMLREIGKKNEKVELEFLDQHAADMPRTMLRYAIEKLDAEDRQHYLSIKKST